MVNARSTESIVLPGEPQGTHICVAASHGELYLCRVQKWSSKAGLQLSCHEGVHVVCKVCPYLAPTSCCQPVHEFSKCDWLCLNQTAILASGEAALQSRSSDRPAKESDIAGGPHPGHNTCCWVSKFWGPVPSMGVIQPLQPCDQKGCRNWGKSCILLSHLNHFSSPKRLFLFAFHRRQCLKLPFFSGLGSHQTQCLGLPPCLTWSTWISASKTPVPEKNALGGGQEWKKNVRFSVLQPNGHKGHHSQPAACPPLNTCQLTTHCGEWTCLHGWPSKNSWDNWCHHNADQFIVLAISHKDITTAGQMLSQGQDQIKHHLPHSPLVYSLHIHIHIFSQVPHRMCRNCYAGSHQWFS